MNYRICQKANIFFASCICDQSHEPEDMEGISHKPWDHNHCEREEKDLQIF